MLRFYRWFLGLVLIAFAGAAGAADPVVDDPSDPIAGKSHWAFRPLSRTRPPEVHGTDWPRTTIDRFVMARLEQEDLHPVSDANRRNLIRRVSVQLTGLALDYERVESFVDDERPDALDRVVDELLASPLFGERWGRHWLDLARYADSNGLDENFLFREAWRYRNWVINAINADVPFDRFVLEQLAGDLLPFDSIEQRDRQRIAAGFLVIGPKVLLGNNDQNQRMEVADELIDTIGRTILGQTLGCCRCHDHKFDPVPTADYYALAGIFASTSVMETRYMLGEQRGMERLVGLGPHGSEADDAYEKYWREQPKLATRKKQAEAVRDAIKNGKSDELAAILEKQSDAIADEAKESSDVISSLEARVAAQETLIADLAKTLANPPQIPPRAMIPVDIDEPADEHIRLAGQFDRLGERVPRGFLQVLNDDNERVKIPEKQSGRVALGHWLMNGQNRTGQLAARVLSNRIWHHLLGQGLVRTVDNFGRTGEAPTHPELLDHLARDLMVSGWSLKTQVRKIVRSRTFALGSHADFANQSIDPENRFYWKSNRRRLDPESYRDAMLAVAGRLDFSPMESTVWYLGDQATAVGPNTVRRRTDFPCRSVYLPVIRNDLPELFEAFDFANPHSSTGARPNTTAPSQALFILNDTMVMDSAELAAQRILVDCPKHDVTALIDSMFKTIFNTTPSDSERHSVAAFLSRTQQRLKSEGSESFELRALAITCQALLASSHFQFLD